MASHARLQAPCLLLAPTKAHTRDIAGHVGAWPARRPMSVPMVRTSAFAVPEATSGPKPAQRHLRAFQGPLQQRTRGLAVRPSRGHAEPVPGLSRSPLRPERPDPLLAGLQQSAALRFRPEAVAPIPDPRFRPPHRRTHRSCRADRPTRTTGPPRQLRWASRARGCTRTRARLGIGRSGRGTHKISLGVGAGGAVRDRHQDTVRTRKPQAPR